MMRLSSVLNIPPEPCHYEQNLWSASRNWGLWLVCGTYRSRGVSCVADGRNGSVDVGPRWRVLPEMYGLLLGLIAKQLTISFRPRAASKFCSRFSQPTSTTVLFRCGDWSSEQKTLLISSAVTTFYYFVEPSASASFAAILKCTTCPWLRVLCSKKTPSPIQPYSQASSTSTSPPMLALAFS